MPSYVYKFVYENEIIYIGKSNSNLDSRINNHGRPGDNIDKKYWDMINSSQIYYIQLANQTMCDVVESELIRRYKPKCNKAKMSDWIGLEFNEPEWKLYEKTKPVVKKQSIKLPSKKEIIQIRKDLIFYRKCLDANIYSDIIELLRHNDDSNIIELKLSKIVYNFLHEDFLKLFRIRFEFKTHFRGVNVCRTMKSKQVGNDYQVKLFFQETRLKNIETYIKLCEWTVMRTIREHEKILSIVDEN